MTQPLQPSRPEQESSSTLLERAAESINASFSAAGLKVTVEPSDSAEFTVSFPGRPPASRLTRMSAADSEAPVALVEPDLPRSPVDDLSERHIVYLASRPEFRAIVIDSMGSDAAALDDGSCPELHNAVSEAFSNDAPQVGSLISGSGDYEFAIAIRGVPGCYYVKASEFDRSPFFYTLEEATSFVYREYGEYGEGVRDMVL